MKLLSWNYFNTEQMTLRASLDFKDGYFTINREERNLAAIFYHTLLINDNLKKFLSAIGCDHKIVEHETAVYYEYAFIRDLWSKIQSNDIKRKFILDMLHPFNREKLERMSVLEFNGYFGLVGRRSSSEFILSPSNWSIKHYDTNISDNSEFLNACKFKWCFNAKPDIVINTSHDTAVCIEAKLGSGEGKYPSNEFEKSVFKKRGLEHVGQLSIQKKLMEEILGIKTDFIFLGVDGKEAHSHKTLKWREAFNCLDISSCPVFIRGWIKLYDL
jgi:hypothetical protein